ncbi:TetR/AcrR family transcriptional regulator [Agromyces protaetiae]|uniref:TetR/AcrR family transcriptional regulator n=1 Tax=Agromyces protaetiae TaxID=2509455 RepID=A0A4P6FHN4_9MICO|nr:TetR/AcrR family transcriptional regulator [Agromyces protaetiae]QAY74049.1 TetR/AcrR family transcriptional regulator [Agromyces protaetiae]
MPRTAPRGGPRTRAKIARVAKRLFFERGFDAVTVAEIARQAGVSPVTVFNHFPRKEDLILDRADDAVELLRAAVRDRTPGVDLLDSLRTLVSPHLDEDRPLAGASPSSLLFLRTVADSPTLISRAREIAATLQSALEEELNADPAFVRDARFFAAFFVAGYSTVVVESASLLLGGAPPYDVAEFQRGRIDRLVGALRNGVTD